VGKNDNQGAAMLKKGVLLVGHGAVAHDCPRELVVELKSLEARRSAQGAEPTVAEKELDQQIRNWPRTAENDPYGEGLKALAERLRPQLGGAELYLAFNEFCAPTVPEAIEQMIAGGITHVSIVPSMLTPGGVHSEIDIPQSIEPLRARYPDVVIRYAWPVDLTLIADMLSSHLSSFSD